MMRRMCWWGKIKPDKIEAYKESHRVVWPELLDLYQRHGISKISCFLRDNDLLVYTEYDPEIYLKGGKEEIAKNEVSQRWGAWMREFALPEWQAVEFEEVFRME